MFLEEAMLKLTTFALLLILFGCTGEAEPTQTPAPTPRPTPTTDETMITILALGDSLTDGFGVDPDMAYPTQLERRLRADGYNVAVTNAGISGETTSGAVSRLDWMLQTEPDIVIIETGGNDGLRGIDLSVTRQNIDALAAAFTEQGAVVVIAGMQIISNLGDEYASEFRAIYPEAAEAHNAILIPFFLEGVAGDPELNQADFIHPTAEGYTVIVENIYPQIVEAVETVQ